MNGSHPRASRHVSVGMSAGLAVLGVVLAGCSADDDPGSRRTETSPGAQPVTDTSTPDDPVAEIETVFGEYWDAVVRAQRGESETPAELFDGIANDDAIQQNASVAVRYAQQGVVRVGEPDVSDVDVEVDGRSATINACVDESDWLAEVGGQTLPPRDDQLEPHLVAYEAIKTGGSWLIGSPVEPEGTSTC